MAKKKLAELWNAERTESIELQFPLSDDELRAARVAYPEHIDAIELAQRHATEGVPPEVMLFYGGQRMGALFVPCMAAVLNFREVVIDTVQPDIVVMVAGELSFATNADAEGYAEGFIDHFLMKCCGARAAQLRAERVANGTIAEDDGSAIAVAGSFERIEALEASGARFAAEAMRAQWAARIEQIRRDADARDADANAWRN